MTRFKVSVGILSTLIFLSVFSGIWVNKRCDKFLQTISQAEYVISSGETEQAVVILKELEKEWENFKKKSSVFVDNKKLSEIDMTFIPLIHEKDNSELDSELAELRHQFELLKKNETPDITGVL